MLANGQNSQPSTSEVNNVEAFLDEELQIDLLVEVYKSYLEDTHQMRAERHAVDNIRVTIVTLFLGAEAYAVSSVFIDPQGRSLFSASLVSLVPVFASMLIGVVGFAFCRNWKRLTEDYSKTLGTKYEGLLKMETKWKRYLEPLGADLFTQEKAARARQKELQSKGIGVGRRNEDLQTFFQRVFGALILGVAIPKAIILFFVLVQPHLPRAHLW